MGVVDNDTKIALLGSNGDQAILGNITLKSKKLGTIKLRPVTSMVFFNKDGNVVWSTPE